MRRSASLYGNNAVLYVMRKAARARHQQLLLSGVLRCMACGGACFYNGAPLGMELHGPSWANLGFILFMVVPPVLIYLVRFISWWFCLVRPLAHENHRHKWRRQCANIPLNDGKSCAGLPSAELYDSASWITAAPRLARSAIRQP